MAEPAVAWDDVPAIDYSSLVTEDDAPVDNLFSERQPTLLEDCLEASYAPGAPFIALADVGVFFQLGEPPVVPDFMLSLGVAFPQDVHKDENRSYYLWRYGKPPDLVVEVVSPTPGGEDTTKLRIYERIKVPYYLIYDPAGYLGRRPVRLFELRGASYLEMANPLVPLDFLGLQLTLWDGVYAQMEARWLRWLDRDGQLLLTGKERAEKAEERAEQAEERARRLAERLRELGQDPDA